MVVLVVAGNIYRECCCCCCCEEDESSASEGGGEAGKAGRASEARPRDNGGQERDGPAFPRGRVPSNGELSEQWPTAVVSEHTAASVLIQRSSCGPTLMTRYCTSDLGFGSTVVVFVLLVPRGILLYFALTENCFTRFQSLINDRGR